MNLPNRDYELYNNNYTSDYNPGLINPKINTFFNDVLNKPDPVYTSVIKTEQSWNKFYKDYIEHNLLFFIILIGVVFFLIIRYYTLDLDPDKKNTDEFGNYLDDSDDTDDTDIDDNDDKKNIKRKLKKKYKSKLKKYKKELYNEKNKILNIIDELSELNYEDKSKNQLIRNNYDKQISQLEYQRKQDNIEQQRQLEELRQLNDIIQAKKNNVMDFQQKKQRQKLNKKLEFDIETKNPLDHTIKNFDDDDDDDDDDDLSNYYNLKKNTKQNKDNFVDGIYIDTPFN